MTLLVPVLDDALEMLSREAPEHLRAMAEALRGNPLDIELPGERFALEADASSVRRTARRPDVAVRVRTTGAAVLALLDGERSLLESVAQDHIVLRGSAGAISALQDGLEWFLLGCARCLRAPAIYDRLRRVVSAQKAGEE